MSIETANIVTKKKTRAEIEREKQNKRKDKYILERKTIMKTI